LPNQIGDSKACSKEIGMSVVAKLDGMWFASGLPQTDRNPVSRIPVASAYAKYTRSSAPRETLPLPSSASM
jgi:hypothetical protein